MSAINFLVLLYTDCFDTYRPVIKMAYGGVITPPNNHTLHILILRVYVGGVMTPSYAIFMTGLYVSKQSVYNRTRKLMADMS